MVRIKLRRRRRVRQEMVAAAVAAVAYHLRLKELSMPKPKAPVISVAEVPKPTEAALTTSSWVINWRYEVSTRLTSRGRVRSW